MATLDAAQALVRHCAPKANRLGICDLPDDVLILVFSSLHGQDVARCIPVCRHFSDLIHSDLSLQYRVELAMNGMVDGESSTLPVSEKLQRLRQYSSHFSSGAFRRQDLTAHPDYLQQDRDILGWPRRVIHPTKPTGAIYAKADQDDSALYLSHFVPGSALAGIPSGRSLFSVRDGVKPDLALKGWAVDDAQDLFVMVDMSRMRMPTNVSPDVCIRFCSLSGLKVDTVLPAPHAAATLPVIYLYAFGPAKPINVFQPQILGPYLILAIHVDMGARQLSYFIDVYNWRTGETVSRSNAGKVLVSIVPLDEPYLLLFPSIMMPEPHPDLRIYSFAPSPSSQARAGRHVCTLELPPAPPGELVTWSQAPSGGRLSEEESAGHFRADATRVYVFDVNPLVARSALRVPRDSAAMTAIVDAGDIERVLPGVVDPKCAAIPYVVYRFPLPYPDPPSTNAGLPGLPAPLPEIRAVTMSMAGFTVQFDDSVEYEKRFQTCTV